MQNDVDARVIPFKAPASMVEIDLAARFARLADVFVNAYAGLDDPDTLRAKVIDLEQVADQLDIALLESGEYPLRGAVLADLVRRQIPENLHHLLGAPDSCPDWGDAL